MKFSALLNLGAAKVDRANSRINGVSIVTVGDAKGHNVECDFTTLRQVMECAKEYASGLKVKFNPLTFDHGPAGLVARFDPTSYRIEGDQLFGDLLVSKFSADRDYLFELAEEQPENFGLSMEFSGPTETINGRKFARCDEIFAATVVDMPAANKAGFFRAIEGNHTTQNQGDTMTAEELKAALDGALKPLSERLDKIESSTHRNCSVPTAEELKEAGVLETDTDDQKREKVTKFREELDQPMTTRKFMQMFAKAGGRAAGHSGGEGASGKAANDNQEGGKKIHAFQKRLNDYTATGMKPEIAMFRAKEDAPKDYNDFVTSGASQSNTEAAK